MADATGRFVWYDLMTTDTEKAKEFYVQVTGWGLEDWTGRGDPATPYTMWTVGGAPIGGVNLLPTRGPGSDGPRWIGYVQVDDVDATVRRAHELGGSVVGDVTVAPDVGRWAVLADPHGAVIAAFTPESSSDPPAGDPRPGDISWHELATTADVDDAWDFYEALFGWERTGSFDMGEGWMYRMFGVPGRELGGMFTRSREMPGPAAWIVYVHVPDLERSLEAVEAAGGHVVNGPTEVPGGDRVAQCVDPQGAVFALHAKAAG